MLANFDLSFPISYFCEHTIEEGRAQATKRAAKP
jgi:hypothetical protein